MLGVFAVAAFGETSTVELKTAGGHSIEYYLALPQGWTATKKWPVVVIIESANRQFRETTDVFVKARGARPFILVTPLVVTNGGSGYRGVPTYHYSTAVWDQIEKTGGCRFDTEGIQAVVADVRKLYGGEDRYFLAGWEAAGHTVWPMIFEHPEALRAAALSGPNYAGRCMDESRFSTNPARVDLPVKVFQGAADPPNRYFVAQWEEAKKQAEAHGYRNLSLVVVREKHHGPLAEEVLEFFSTIQECCR